MEECFSLTPKKENEIGEDIMEFILCDLENNEIKEYSGQMDNWVYFFKQVMPTLEWEKKHGDK